MKYIIILIITTATIVSGINWYFTKGRVEQEIRKDNSRLICKSGTCMTTFVWYDSEIVADWWDDTSTLTDSIIKVRQVNGEKLIERLDLMK